MIGSSRRALLTGVSCYASSAISDLPAVQNDLKNLRDVLRDYHFTVDILGLDESLPQSDSDEGASSSYRDSLLSRSNLLGKLRNACKEAKQGETLLLYFSGHGLNFKGKDYLAPADTRLDDEEALTEYLVPVDLGGAVNQSQADSIVFLIDACREGVEFGGRKSLSLVNWSKRRRGIASNQHLVYLYGCGPGQFCRVLKDNVGSLFTSAFTKVLCQHRFIDGTVRGVAKSTQEVMDQLAKEHNLERQELRTVGETSLVSGAESRIMFDAIELPPIIRREITPGNAFFTRPAQAGTAAISVWIRAQTDQRVQVTWIINGAPFSTYVILRDQLEHCACRIRSSLSQLARAAAHLHQGMLGSILTNLVEHGQLLYRVLFADIGGGGDARRIRDYLEGLASQEHVTLRFVTDFSVCVPWGLVYPKGVELPKDANSHSWQDYRGFWCLRHSLSTTYVEIAPDPPESGDYGPLKVLQIVNRDAYDAAAKSVPDSEREFLSWLEGQHGDPIGTTAAFHERWRATGHEIGLLHFYCHTGAGNFLLSSGDKLDSTELSLILSDSKERLPGAPDCLVVINGSSTAFEKPSFLGAISRHGFCGFVGTEAQVPSLFALRFSIRLLNLLFYNGLSLGEAMLQMYQMHFPLSLIYGLYARPEFRIPQNGIGGLPPAGNLSLCTVSTDQA